MYIYVCVLGWGTVWGEAVYGSTVAPAHMVCARGRSTPLRSLYDVFMASNSPRRTPFIEAADGGGTVSGKAAKQRVQATPNGTRPCAYLDTSDRHQAPSEYPCAEQDHMRKVRRYYWRCHASLPAHACRHCSGEARRWRSMEAAGDRRACGFRGSRRQGEACRSSPNALIAVHYSEGVEYVTVVHGVCAPLLQLALHRRTANVNTGTYVRKTMRVRTWACASE